MTTDAILIIMLILIVAGVGIAVWDEVNWGKGWRRYVEKEEATNSKKKGR